MPHDDALHEAVQAALDVAGYRPDAVETNFDLSKYRDAAIDAVLTYLRGLEPVEPMTASFDLYWYRDALAAAKGDLRDSLEQFRLLKHACDAIEARSVEVKIENAALRAQLDAMKQDRTAILNDHLGGMHGGRDD